MDNPVITVAKEIMLSSVSGILSACLFPAGLLINYGRIFVNLWRQVEHGPWNNPFFCELGHFSTFRLFLNLLF